MIRQSVIDTVDDLSRKYLEAQSGMIAEHGFGQSALQERRALMIDVNHARETVGLPLLDPPDHWPCLECNTFHEDECDDLWGAAVE